MKTVFETLAPILIITLLGKGLRIWGIFNATVVDGVNRVVYWVCLPSLLFRSIATTTPPGPEVARLLGLLLGVTLLVAALGWLAAVLLQLPTKARGTLSQAAFRGNLALVGIPVLESALPDSPSGRTVFATALAIIVFLMIAFNLIAVVVLQLSQTESTPRAFCHALSAMIFNPLILAAVAGLGWNSLPFDLPVFLDHSLGFLGAAAIPMSLLTIGASLRIRGGFPPKRGVITAALLKTVVSPLLTVALLPMFFLSPEDAFVAVLLATTPTAAAAYIMACEMDGDRELASESIAISTLLSAPALAGALLWFRSATG